MGGGGLEFSLHAKKTGFPAFFYIAHENQQFKLFDEIHRLKSSQWLVKITLIPSNFVCTFATFAFGGKFTMVFRANGKRSELH